MVSPDLNGEEVNQMEIETTNQGRIPLAIRLAVMASVLCGAIAVPSGFAFATLPADPTGGALADVESGVQTWVITYGVPVVFTLLTLGILIRLGMKWAKRAGSKI